MSSRLQISDEYGLVIAAVGSVGITAIYLSSLVMSARGKAFKGKAFVDSKAVQAMQEEHKKAFNTPLNTMGYPDMGSGRYAAELDYKSWVEFNNAQRAHYNMVESAAPVIGCILATGLSLPRMAASLGFAFSIGRVLYGMGYTSSKGADGRVAGAAVAGLAAMALYLTAVIQGLRIGLGV